MHLSNRTVARVLGCCLMAAPALALAQAPVPPKPAVGAAVPPSQIYDRLLSGMESEFVSAAEAMPEEKFNYAPTTAIGEFKGVRTFAGQIRHVIAANYEFWSDPETTPPDEKSFDKLATKAELVQALKDSFARGHAYIATITPENAFVVTKRGTRAGMAAFGIAHFMDHYGQMVEYLRLNGIVPPASRGGM